MPEADLVAYERRFRRAGLPLLIEDYSATQDVFTRAVPLLTLVVLAELLGAVNLEWGFVANLLSLIGGVVFVLALVGVVNLLRGRRFFALPHSVGAVELVAFVVVPALLPIVFNGQETSALVTALVNVCILALAYLMIGFGLVSIVGWAAGRLLGQLAASLVLLTRALPLLLIFALVLFINTEMWQVFSDVPRVFLAPLAGLVIGLGLAFLVSRLPKEVRTLEREAGGDGPPLSERQRINVGLVMLISQGLQVLVVSLAVGAFFVAFGLLAVGPNVIDTWIGSDGNVLVRFDLVGETVVLTEALLRVAGAIAAFTGLYYAIAVLTDATYREEFLDELTTEMRTTFKARAEYLKLRADGARADPQAG